MDDLVSNPKKKMQKGMMIPPPPIPAALEIASRIGRRMIPMNSRYVIGKIDLCRHSPSSQISNGAL